MPLRIFITTEAGSGKPGRAVASPQCWKPEVSSASGLFAGPGYAGEAGVSRVRM
jgi:hypothetical protein